MKGPSRGLLITITALLLLSAGVVWQQQRRKTAAPPAGGAGPTTGGNAAGASRPTSLSGSRENGSTAQGAPPSVAQGIPAAAPELPPSGTVTAPQAPPTSAPPQTKPVMPLEPLISQSAKQNLIARDGTPLRLELSPGNPGSAVELQAWTQDQTRNAASRYDWRFKITVPAGGLVERIDPAQFSAPEGGYLPEFDYAMDQDLPANQWSNSMAKSFFIRFNNDTYGLLNLQMVAGGAHFVTVKAWINPATGSRNLQQPPAPPMKRR